MRDRETFAPFILAERRSPLLVISNDGGFSRSTPAALLSTDNSLDDNDWIVVITVDTGN